MRLLLVRHAIAEDREEFARSGHPDDERPLTRKGQRRMRTVARALRAIVRSLDVVATSPLVRARQTADILAAAYAIDGVACVDALLPDRAPDELEAWLCTLEAEMTVAVVGHEPHMGRAATWLVTGSDERAAIEFKKGGACLLAFDGQPLAGHGTVIWAAPPRILRRMGD